MDHTPTTPARDDRPLRLLERAEVDDDHKQRLLALVRHAQGASEEAGDDLQAEFGREHVALIVGCNQFVRVYRAGDTAGRVELLLPEPAKAQLKEAGFTLHEPLGAIFKMFGWVSVDPREGDLDHLERAIDAALERARGAKKPAL